jgi:DNA-binding NarL/FixJ family response regulator
MNILLVDDHPMVREGLRAVLEQEPDLRVAGEAGDGQTALEACDLLHPDVVVMDVGLPGLDGIEATRLLRSRAPGSRVVALSMNADRRYVEAMLSAGAWAYLVKSAPTAELVRAIRAVAQGERYLSPEVARAPAERGGAEVGARLSPRERDVLRLVAEGLTSKECAVRLGVAVSTIETHRKQLMAKLKLRSVAELTKFAIRTGLTSLD